MQLTRSNLQLPYSQSNYEALLKTVFGRHIGIEVKAEKIIVANSNVKSIERFASVSLNENRNIAVLDITTSQNVQVNKNRVGLRNIAARLIDQDKYHGILAFYHSEDTTQQDYRLSFISSQSAFDGEGQLATKSTHPKRYSFILGTNQSCNTAAQRLEKLKSSTAKGVSLEDVTNAFSVSSLTKEFYNELFKWYQWALTEEVGITFPKNTNITEDDREKLEEQIIRLITRLLFVWFIKQKQLVPNYLFETKELKRALKDFDPTSTTNGNYYNAILQNLFFATLNKAVGERAFAKEKYNRDIKTLYRYAEMFNISENEVLELFKPIPFLNGGLFECLDKESIDGNKYFLDGFSRNDTIQKGHFKHRAFIPNCVFFDEEKGIIPLLERYNFTVEENAPEDVQVALDPELLGNVFENLLGAYNSETKESARKQSGSFYTPREIVDFMVSESLLVYLQNDFSEQKDTIRNLFENEELPDELKSNHKLCKAISDKLKAIKIIDTACGSGAFPMGILKKMVEVLEKLDLNNVKTVYDQKLHLIEECIYGVDIQTIAAQISKLRFFISLIVEQEGMDLSRPEENYGVITLPNLETKFVAANTLIGLSSNNKHLLELNDAKLIEMKKQLWQIRHDHFYAAKASEKKKLREKDKKLREEIKNYIAENATKPDHELIEKYNAELKKLEREREQYEGENWVEETGKPVQTVMFTDNHNKQHSLFRIDINKKERERIDKMAKNLQNSIEKENNKSKPTGFEAEIETLAEWNPYDQNASSPFFDAEWMFGVIDGFDVVIGNPPYVGLSKNSGTLAKIYQNHGFETFEKSGDIYSMFYEKGWHLLKPKGILCFITSNGWMRNDHGESTRRFFAEYTNPILLIDFAGQKIFETATVEVNILMFKRDKNQQKTLACIVKENVLNKLSVFVRQTAVESSFTTSESWVILSPIEQRIKAKIEARGTPLKDWKINIYRGVLTGYNEAFIIDGAKRKELIAEDPKSAEIIRAFLLDRLDVFVHSQMQIVG